ncbi:MAG: hypothetical protein ACK5MD_09370 [Flavobacteriales bacterium]
MKTHFLNAKLAILSLGFVSVMACSSDDSSNGTTYQSTDAGEVDNLSVGTNVSVKGTIVNHVPGTVGQFYLVDSKSDTVVCDITNYANKVSYNNETITVNGVVTAINTRASNSIHYVKANDVQGLSSENALNDAVTIAEIKQNANTWDRQDRRVRLSAEVTGNPVRYGDDYLVEVSDGSGQTINLEFDDEWINSIKSGEIITFAAEVDVTNNVAYLELEYLIGENGYNPDNSSDVSTVAGVLSKAQALDDAEVTVKLTGRFTNSYTKGNDDDIYMTFEDSTGSIECEIDDDYAAPQLNTEYTIWAEVDYERSGTQLNLEYYKQ